MGEVFFHFKEPAADAGLPWGEPLEGEARGREARGEESRLDCPGPGEHFHRVAILQGALDYPEARIAYPRIAGVRAHPDAQAFRKKAQDP